MVQPFEEEMLNQARDLIVQQKFAEAKTILLQIPDNLIAKEWLEKIARIELGDPFTGQLGQLPSTPAKPKRFLGSSPRAWMLFIILICVCCAASTLVPKPPSVSTSPTQSSTSKSFAGASSNKDQSATPIVSITPTEAAITSPTQSSTSKSFAGASSNKDQSATPIASITPTEDSTSTNTPIPSTATQTNTPNATEKALIRFENATATAEELLFIRTRQSDDKTATADAKQATKDFIASFKPIARQELVSYADNHIGESVVVKGRVFNIINSKALQLYLAGSRDAVYIEFAESFSGIYENDSVTVYAIVVGYAEGTNAFGGTVRQPSLIGVVISK